MVHINNLYKISITSSSYYQINPSSVTFNISVTDFSNNPTTLSNVSVESSDALASYTTNSNTVSLNGNSALINISNGSASVTVNVNHTTDDFIYLKIGNVKCEVYVEKQSSPTLTYVTSSAKNENGNNINVAFSDKQSNPVSIRVKDKIVNIKGAITCDKAFVSSSEDYIKMAILPLNIRPSYDVYRLQQGSNPNKFFMKISHEDGGIYLLRYGTTTTTATVPNGAYLTVDISYII